MKNPFKKVEEQPKSGNIENYLRQQSILFHKDKGKEEILEQDKFNFSINSVTNHIREKLTNIDEVLLESF